MMSTNSYIVVAKREINKCSTEAEAFEIVSNLQNTNPHEEYEVLEIHPPRPKGLGRDPDLYD
jgi:hypothetical protein